MGREVRRHWQDVKKMYSSMTACGPLMQNWRVEWQGQKVEVPVEHQDDFQKRWWF